MDYRRKIACIILFVLAIGFSSSIVEAQEEYGTYRFIPAPDIWYNSVDGIRLGLRVLGEQEGSFRDGPHRLDAGFWIGTNIPENPFSYYLGFTEPIKSISDFGEEGSFQVISSIRTGLSQHTISLNKRWQDGFNELIYREISVSLNQSKMFDYDYRPYPILWSNNWNSLLGLNFITHNESDKNIFEASVSFQQNLNPESESFSVVDLEITNVHPFNAKFGLATRLFGGFTSDNTAPEFLYTASYAQPIKWGGNGVSRAKGTIPTNWLDNGLAQVSGGANLRGYTDTKFSDLTVIGFNSVLAFNGELEFPNPISSSLKKGIIGDFVFLKTYAFFDAGTVFDDNTVLLDAGLGLQFSINIPDFLGKPRGFGLRYEVPFWISEPDAGDSSFDFRNLIGFGAVISL